MLQTLDLEKWKSYALGLRDYALQNKKSLMVISGLWGVTCWLLNVALIVGYYNGWGKVPPALEFSFLMSN